MTDPCLDKLLADGLKEPRCEECGNFNWMGKPIPLKVYHRDRDEKNTDLSNLVVLCGNCAEQKGIG